jgi:hypothetical protein
MGTDEITLPVYVGAMFDYHWNDHAGQIAEIRKANGCLTPEAVARAGNHVQAKRRLAFRFFAWMTAMAHFWVDGLCSYRRHEKESAQGPAAPLVPAR